jgi:hypothetical protein
MEPAMRPLAEMRQFYVGLSVLVILIAFTGFWPSYFGPLFAGTVDKPSFIHLHAAVYVGWLALFTAQIAFAATRRMALHVTFGNIGIGYGVLVIIIGLVAAFGMFAVRVQAGEVAQAQARLLPPLLDMVLFTPLFAAAVYHRRRRPELHKRLMVVATTTLLVAAVARMPFLGTPIPVGILLLVWSAPVLLAIAYDAVRRHSVHPIYLLGLIVIALRGVGAPIVRGTDAWRSVSGWLATLVT